MDAESATILVERQHRDRVGAIFSSEVPVGRTSDYHAAFLQDPFVDLEPGRAVTIAEYLGSESVATSPFMRNFMIPHGVFHVLGMDMIEPGETRVRLRATRPLGSEDFDERDKAIFQAGSLHFNQAIRLFLRLSRLETEREVFAAALTRLSVGAILVSQSGEVVQATKGAREFLERRDTLLVSQNRLVVAYDPAKQAELREAIDRMAMADSSAGVHAISLEVPDGSSVGILVRPASAASRLNAPLRNEALVLITDTSPQVAPSARVLSQLFGLTRSEAELTAHLCQGSSLDEVAVALGISKNTAKAHLRQIFSKTGATRQSMLVRLVLRSVDELN